MKKRKIPLGKSSFKEIIEGNYYYCDKTKLIEEVLDEGFEVNLFTRPRRFGKTLNMSTLKYFFDVKNAEENRKIERNDIFDILILSSVELNDDVKSNEKNINTFLENNIPLIKEVWDELIHD